MPRAVYETAYQLAQEQLTQFDLTEVAFNSSTRLEEETLYLDFLGETYQIANRGAQIIRSNQEVKIGEKILLLHYLITADGTSLAHQEITFKNIPGARFYYPTFKARTIDHLVKTFGTGFDYEVLNRAVQKIGGRILESVDSEHIPEKSVNPVRKSDNKVRNDSHNSHDNITKLSNGVKMKFLVLPNVPITLVWWRGDTETGAAAQILYDTSITHYLPLEDIVVITELLVHKLIQATKSVTTGGPLYDL